MTLYRKRMPTTQAAQLGDPAELPEWCREALFRRQHGDMIVRTMEGDLEILFGDWIVRLPLGQIAVKTNKNFREEYEELPSSNQ